MFASTCRDRQLTLDAFGQVAEVENVVRLGGRRQEVGTHSTIDVAGRLHDGIGALAHRLREVREKPVEYRLKHSDRFKMSPCSSTIQSVSMLLLIRLHIV